MALDLAGKTLDEKIQIVNDRISYLTNQIALNNAQIVKEKQSYSDWAAAGNYDEAHRHSDYVVQLQASNDAMSAEIVTLRSVLADLLAQKKVVIDAQAALVNQTNTTQTLTAEQQSAIQLAKINAEKAAAEAQATAEADKEKTAEAEKAKTKRYYIIGGIVAFVVIVVVAVVLIKKK